jgi:hypothetical protein
MSSAVWGTPKYESGNRFKKTEGPKAGGDTALRILPPMFSLREEGEWRKWWSTHWGYAGVKDDEPGKTVMRPFRCILDEDYRTGMVRQECPACTRYAAVEAEKKEEEAKILARLKEEAAAAGQTFDPESKAVKEALEAELESINQWLKSYRVEGKFYVNAMFEDGSFGSFKLNSKFHMSRIKEFTNGKFEKGKQVKPSLLESDGIDPIAPDQGVWFVISRTGNGFGTPDTVDIKYEKIEAIVNGKKMMVPQIVQAPLTAEMAERASKECQDLVTMGGRELTYDQIKRLVECSGEPEEVDEIMGIEHKKAGTKPAVIPPAQKTAAKPVAAAVAVKPAAIATPAVKPAVTPPAAKASAKIDLNDPAIQKRIADIKAKKAAEEAAKKAAEEAAKKAAEEAAKKAAEAQAEAEALLAAEAGQDSVDSAPAEQGVDLAGMTDEDFMASIGSGPGITT